MFGILLMLAGLLYAWIGMCASLSTRHIPVVYGLTATGFVLYVLEIIHAAGF